MNEIIILILLLVILYQVFRLEKKITNETTWLEKKIDVAYLGLLKEIAPEEEKKHDEKICKDLNDNHHNKNKK